VRAYVTGGHGFVGTWLAAHLSDSGDEVFAPRMAEVDVTDATAVAESMSSISPDAVYHLAGLAHVGGSWDAPDRYFRVNALGTLSVLEAARRCATPPRVLVVSSAEVYGAVRAEQLPVDEDAPMLPRSPYASSEAAAELVAVQAYLGRGLPVIRARPFNHVGPGQDPGFVVPAVARRIVEASRDGRTTLPVGNLTARRDLTDVRDVVRAYRLLVELGSPGQVYNVCSGADVSIEEILRRLLDLAGARLRPEPDPDLVRPVDVPVLLGDPGRLRAATGWAPEIPLDATLQAVLEDETRSGSGVASFSGATPRPGRH